MATWHDLPDELEEKLLARARVVHSLVVTRRMTMNCMSMPLGEASVLVVLIHFCSATVTHWQARERRGTE
jgi:hypothetical protein